MTGESLRRARLAAGWSGPRLAERVGVSANTVYRWERGEVRITEPIRRLLLSVLPRSVRSLL